MKDEFERRMRTAARRERLEEPSRVDRSLRALVEQLHGGPPAPTSEAPTPEGYRMVGGELRRREKKP